VNRANKNFPHKSTDFSAICGERILKNNKGARVDLTAPKTEVSIDIRDGIAYVYDKVFVGVGGLPVGSSGKALCFLSGGIDSPVAAYLAAKRGLSVDFVHFATPPYTSTAAIDKVKRLVKILTQYGCGNKLRVVNITEPMTLIRERRDKQYTITLMRRLMVRIATLLCAKGKYDCIITGENLAQVASQTVKGIASNDCVASKIPILRPLITYDKNEIISVARRIGTYNISIEPHADCCTVFVPESPIISPTIERCEREESIIDKEQYKPSGDKYNILTIASTSEIIIV
jgi:thiamine biosynthesis protein ThiI